VAEGFKKMTNNNIKTAPTGAAVAYATMSQVNLCGGNWEFTPWHVGDHPSHRLATGCGPFSGHTARVWCQNGIKTPDPLLTAVLKEGVITFFQYTPDVAFNVWTQKAATLWGSDCPSLKREGVSVGDKVPFLIVPKTREVRLSDYTGKETGLLKVNNKGEVIRPDGQKVIFLKSSRDDFKENPLLVYKNLQDQLQAEIGSAGELVWGDGFCDTRGLYARAKALDRVIPGGRPHNEDDFLREFELYDPKSFYRGHPYHSKGFPDAKP